MTRSVTKTACLGIRDDAVLEGNYIVFGTHSVYPRRNNSALITNPKKPQPIARKRIGSLASFANSVPASCSRSSRRHWPWRPKIARMRARAAIGQCCKSPPSWHSLPSLTADIAAGRSKPKPNRALKRQRVDNVSLLHDLQQSLHHQRARRLACRFHQLAPVVWLTYKPCHFRRSACLAHGAFAEQGQCCRPQFSNRRSHTGLLRSS